MQIELDFSSKTVEGKMGGGCHPGHATHEIPIPVAILLQSLGVCLECLKVGWTMVKLYG